LIILRKSTPSAAHNNGVLAEGLFCAKIKALFIKTIMSNLRAAK